ncbi:MAG: uroporphyrinogen decarboxylase family protein [Planctomycetota bacterium]|jgi:hypothetical protein|nr:uroporphyrinogen decarboxylase family protein [Planctomycetota bacterium]
MLTPKERILKTLDGQEVDRLPVYDIIHNVELIEYLADDKITSANAEDITCKAVSKVLDLVRHFCVPSSLEERTYRDEDGFVYLHQWWTREIVERPNTTVEQTRDLMKRDVDRIHKAIEEGKVCWQALEHLELLGEHCQTFEEVKELFLRIANKLDGTCMVAPESLPGMYTALNRYGFEMTIYAYYDYPDDFFAMYHALCDYEVAKIHALGDLVEVAPVALLSEAVAYNTGLMFSPEFIREVQYPNIKRIIDALKSHGYKVIFHADGTKWEILDDIVSFGADIIDPCETMANMDIRKFRELYPDTTIASPVDCQELLALGPKERIADACWKVLDDCGGKRVLTGSTSEIHPGISVENAMTMYDIFRNQAVRS